MTALDHEYSADEDAQAGTSYTVGYKRPPQHTRFQPGVSGNPSGRRKGSKNIRSIFEKILGEEISLREGSVTKKITKAEAVVRSLVISAMKGDSRSQQNLFRLAEQIGQFVEPPAPLQRIERVIVDPRDMRRDLVEIGADEP
jgi:hypothetical protein